MANFFLFVLLLSLSHQMYLPSSSNLQLPPAHYRNKRCCRVRLEVVDCSDTMNKYCGEVQGCMIVSQVDCFLVMAKTCIVSRDEVLEENMEGMLVGQSGFTLSLPYVWL